jgi:hypothetical protein
MRASGTRRTFGIGLASASLLGPLLSSRARAASDEDLARMFAAGRLGDARPAADRALAEGQTSTVLRLMAGALRFADGDYSGAGHFFDSDEPVGGYLMGGPLDLDVLRTHLRGESWRHLASLRVGKALSDMDAVQITMLLTNDVEIYAEQQAALDRAFYDGFVLSIASSQGRTQFLDNQAVRARSQHRCTAHFVRAEAAIAADRMTDARASLDAATSMAQPELLEYHVARAEQARLG